MSSTEQRIAKIIRFLAEQAGREFVSVRVVREALANPADFDRAMIGLYCSQVVNLVPQACQANLSDEDRAAAVRCGGESKHLVALALVA
jgi:hypothetical protein